MYIDLKSICIMKEKIKCITEKYIKNLFIYLFHVTGYGWGLVA